MILVAVLGYLALATLALCARWTVVGELVCSFQPFLGLCGVACGGLLLFFRRRSRRCAGGLCALTGLALLLPMLRYLPFRSPDRHATTEFRLATLNLNMRQPDTLQLEGWLKTSDPDIVACQETCAETENWLHEWLIPQGYLAAAPKPDSGRRLASAGQACFTRLPLTEFRVVHGGWHNAGLLVADLVLDGRPLRIIATHGTKPRNGERLRERNQAFRSIARLAAETSAVVVCGDLNVTGFSPFFLDLLRDGRLTDSRDGIGWQASFTPTDPITLPRPVLALDHVLLGPGLTVLERRVGPNIGSDHLPVLARIGFVE